MDAIKIKVVLFTSKVYSNGRSPILIRITNNRKSRYIATGYSATINNWDDENNCLIESKNKIRQGKSPIKNARAINNDIEIKVREALGVKQKLTIQGAHASASSIKKELTQDGYNEADFIKYAENRIQQLEDSGQFRTYKRYKSVISRLKEYINESNFSYSDLSVEFLNRYQVHLSKTGYLVEKDGQPAKKQSYHTNTIYNIFKTIRAIISTAIQEGKMPADKNPFISFKFKMVKTNKEKLTWEELKRIEKLSLEPGTSLWHCRNYFMFSFYNAGIRAGDLIQLKWANIRDGRLVYQMDKTTRNKSIRLQDQALEILKYYNVRDTKSSDYIFQLLKNNIDYSTKRVLYNNISSQNAMINRNLKQIAELAKIEKPLSFHISRHSFSDLARKKGASIYDISKALGHSNTKITETYLASFDEESLDQTMDNIFLL